MTLREIAQEAGVSISTVSRVINQNNSSAASKEVQDRIWEIVRRTGYTPNSSARNLKNGAAELSSEPSHSIACLFARTPEAITDPFFSQLARSIEKEAFKQNYILKYSFTSIDIQHPSTFHLIANNQVDGVAVLGRCNKQLLSFLKKYFNYVIYTGLNSLNAKYDQVLCEGLAASEAAVEYLVSLGHREIAYVGETVDEERYLGYTAALQKHGLPLRSEYVSNVILSSEGGYSGTKALLERTRSMTAVFCPNDLTAIGAMRALQESGLRIPEDVSIIGIDDIDMAQYLSPMLTTVHVPLDEMGKTAAKILIDRIQGGHSLPMRITMPFYLAIRESCAPPRKRALQPM